jgi:hypothetical protein
MAALAAGAPMAVCRLTARPFRAATLELPKSRRIVTPFGWSRSGPALHESCPRLTPDQFPLIPGYPIRVPG